MNFCTRCDRNPCRFLLCDACYAAASVDDHAEVDWITWPSAVLSLVPEDREGD